ncbi:MAG: hypothetical protein ACLVB5_02265 [Christensenellales bacterium]
MMYISELPTVYKVFAALMLANLAMLVVGCLGVRFFAKIVSVERRCSTRSFWSSPCWARSPSTKTCSTWVCAWSSA